MKDNEHLAIGYYSYSNRERKMKTNNITADNIEIIHLSLTEDTCYFEMIATEPEAFDRSVHEDQWRTIASEFWPLAKELIVVITGWMENQLTHSRFRILESQGNKIQCHFHGYDLENTPWNNLQIYVHTTWLDSLRRIEYDFIDLSFIIEQHHELENNELLSRRIELMDSLTKFKTGFELFLTNIAKIVIKDSTLRVALQPIEVESDYDHETYSWSFKMKGIVV